MPFDIFASGSSNIYNNTDYAGRTELTNGFQPNTVISSKMFNSFMLAASKLLDAMTADFGVTIRPQTVESAIKSEVKFMTPIENDGSQFSNSCDHIRLTIPKMLAGGRNCDDVTFCIRLDSAGNAGQAILQVSSNCLQTSKNLDLELDTTDPQHTTYVIVNVKTLLNSSNYNLKAVEIKEFESKFQGGNNPTNKSIKFVAEVTSTLSSLTIDLEDASGNTYTFDDFAISGTTCDYAESSGYAVTEI